MYRYSSDSSSFTSAQEICPECLEYLNVSQFAENFVDGIIKEARDTIQCERTYEATRDPNNSIGRDEGSVFTYSLIDSTKHEFTSWPKIGDFTIELGARKINEYLSSFPVEEEWLYAIYYLKTKCEKISDMHIYEAKWSLPTACYPIAQSTASIFFTIEVSRVLPKNCLVRVTYQLETNSYIHSSEALIFNERWLLYILDAKIKFFQNVDINYVRIQFIDSSLQV